MSKATMSPENRIQAQLKFDARKAERMARLHLANCIEFYSRAEFTPAPIR